MQWQVIFHVDENSERGAKEWLTRASEILKHNEDLLVKASTGEGKWCEGHVFPPQQEPSSGEPPKVLEMGPRG